MGRSRLYLIWIVAGLCSLIYFSAHAQQSCRDVFAITEPSVMSDLDQLILIETRISFFEQKRQNLLADPFIAKLHEKVNLLLEQASDQIGSDDVKFSATLKKLSTELAELELSSMILAMGTHADLPVLIENPLLLRPGLLYTVTGLDHHLRRVSFSENVLQGVFWNRLHVQQRAVVLIHKSLQRGRIHATDTSGVSQYTQDPAVYRVRITGDIVGVLRLAGFFDGEDFHIVAWSTESTHGSHATSRIIDQVNHIRNTFLQTGHY